MATIGTGAQVKIGSDAAPVFSEWALDATNLATNPNVEATIGTVEVRRNLVTNPSFEVNTAGWSGGNGGGALSRVTTDAVYGAACGSYVAGATLAGDKGPQFSGVPTVVGTVYTASVWIKQSALFTTSGARLGAFSGSAWIGISSYTTVVGSWIRLSVTFTATTTATTFVVGAPQVSNQAGANMLVDALLVEASPVLGSYFDGATAPRVRENLANNPSFEAGTGGVALSGLGALTRVSDWAHSGTWSMKVVAGNSSASGDLRFDGSSATTFPLGMRPGGTYTVSAYVNYLTAHTSFGTASSSRQRRILFFYSTNGTGFTEAFGPQAPNTPGVHRLSHTFTVPANATGVVVGIGAAGSVDDANMVQYIDSILVEEGSTLGDYFDGDTATSPGLDYDWVGAAGVSRSYQYDVDLTQAWLGTANASASRLTAPGTAGVTAATAGQAISYSTTYLPDRGTRSHRHYLAPASAGAAIGINVSDTALTTGQQYTLIFRARAVDRNQQVIPRIRTAQGPTVTLVKGQWTDIRLTINAGSGVTAQTGLLINTGSGHQWGDRIDIDSVVIVAGSYAGGYFDGSTPDDSLTQYSWTSSTNGSSSTLQRRTMLSDGMASRWNIADYTVAEDSTPLDPSDRTGGFGQITINLPESADAKRLMGEPLVLTDGAKGETTGTVRTLSGSGLEAQITAHSRIGLLAVERTIQPFVGNLGDCLEYHLSLCGITTGIVIDDDFYLRDVQVPGGRENVYDRLRDLGAAYGFEMSLVSNNIVFREPRGRVAVNYRNANVSWSLDQSELAQSIVSHWYNTWSGTDCAYPPQREVDAVDVYQVDAGETKVYEVEMDASLSSIEQPTPVSSVDKNDFSASVYTISSMSTTEGVGMDPAIWTGAGGFVRVEVGEDTKTLTITIRGADLPELGPFRIAMPDGTGEFYSSLRVRGDGVFWRKERFEMHLIEDQDIAPDEIGVEVDSPYMETFDQMYHRILLTAARFSNDTQLIRVSTGGINRLGESGSARYPTIGDVNAAYAGETIGSIQAHLGPTIADWNATLLAMVSNDFANQAYGNVAGARVVHDNCYYRIRSASIKPNSVEYTAQRDNTIGDVYHYGETIGEWNARHAGKTIRDVNIAPLKEEEAL